MEIRSLFCGSYAFFFNFIYKIINGKKYRCTFFNSFPISSRFKIGKDGTLIIGSHLSAMRNLEIYVCTNSKIQIGNNVNFNSDCAVVSREEITIGDKCIFGPNCKVYDHDHDYTKIGNERKTQFITKKVEIGNGVWFGANCVVLKGTKIGDNCVFGAGSIIKGKYPPNTLVTQKIIENERNIIYK